MSDIGFSYDAHTEPGRIDLTAVVEASGNEVRARIVDISPFVCVLNPAGNVPTSILSGVAWPIAQTLGAILPQLAKTIVGRLGPLSIASIGPLNVPIAGEMIAIVPSNTSLSNWDGMLKIACDVDIH
jgi:hypothetical protein